MSESSSTPTKDQKQAALDPVNDQSIVIPNTDDLFDEVNWVFPDALPRGYFLKAKMIKFFRKLSLLSQ